MSPGAQTLIMTARFGLSDSFLQYDFDRCAKEITTILAINLPWLMIAGFLVVQFHNVMHRLPFSK